MIVETKAEITLYVLSQIEAQWQRIQSLGYVLLRMQDISALCTKYDDHAVLRFTLLACPSKKVAGDQKNSKRVLLTEPQERLEWLKKQGEKNGFSVLAAKETTDRTHLFSKKETGEFHLTGILFDGILEITDHQLFWQGYQQGIGPEKAYGMGLMMLARV